MKMFDKRISPVYKNKMDFVDENLSASDGIVLDVGCGAGHYFHIYKKKNLIFKGIDVDKKILPINEDVFCADVQYLPFNSSTFDTLIGMDVLEHVKNDKKAIAEIYRVLKKNGKLILSVPNKNYPFVYDPINKFLNLFNYHLPIGLWAWGHRRLYTEKQIKKLLVNQGFKIVRYKKHSYFLVALSVNYTAYLASYVLLPLLKTIGFKKKARFKTKSNLENSPVYNLYSFINKLDKKYFSKYSPIHHCFIVKKS